MLTGATSCRATFGNKINKHQNAAWGKYVCWSVYVAGSDQNMLQNRTPHKQTERLCMGYIKAYKEDSHGVYKKAQNTRCDEHIATKKKKYQYIDIAVGGLLLDGEEMIILLNNQ